MIFNRICLLFFLIVVAIPLFSRAGAVTIDLVDPKYEDGVTSTNQGGVIKFDDVRIQAKNISYTSKYIDGQQIEKIEAKDELMVQYCGKVFVGKSLEYNLTTQHGTVFRGKTQAGDWYIGGEKIFLRPDGTYKVYNSYITTCESSEGEWQIRSRYLTAKDGNLVKARNIQVRFFKFPIFWFPVIKLKLGSLRDIPVKYSAKFGGGQGPRFNMRYELLNWLGWKTYLQLDYWFKHGPGGSLQTDYTSTTGKRDLRTNSFLTYDYKRKSKYRGFRDRLVGEYNDSFYKNKVKVSMQYEVLSDPKVLSTYFNRDYFLHTERHTHLQFRMEEKSFIANLVTTPRVNSFQTVNQQLPELYLHLHPLPIGKTNLNFTSEFTAGYLNYIFGDDAKHIKNFQSGRIKFQPKVFFPINFYPLTVTPFAQYIGIGYSQSLENKAVWQSIVNLGGEANLQFSRFFTPKIKHTIQPYCTYDFFTRPSTPIDDHYIFTSRDAYAKLNQLRFGMRNEIYYKRKSKIYHPMYLDVYSYAFINNDTIGTTIPKIYANLTTYFPILYTEIQSAWNIQHNQIDHINARVDWTISEYAALGVAYFHRGPYYYRKADSENFFLDVFRPQQTLVHSELSDRRDTFLARVYFRFLHNFIFEAYSRTGWDRPNEPKYNEYRLDLTKFLTCNWRVRFSFVHTEQVSTRFSVSLRLGGRPLKEKPEPFIFW